MTKRDVIELIESGTMNGFEIAEVVAMETGIPIQDAVWVVNDLYRDYSETKHAGCWRRVPTPDGEWRLA